MRAFVTGFAIALVAIALVVPTPAKADGINIQVQFGPGCLPPPVCIQPATQPVVVRWSDGSTSVVWVPVEPQQPQIVVPIQPQWQQPWGYQPPPPRWGPPPRRDCWDRPPPRHHDGSGRDSRVRHGGPRRPH